MGPRARPHETALFIITARSGSRRVPQKNLTRLNGLPLLAYKVQAIKRSRFGARSRIILSTDSAAYAAVAARHGIEVPFIRPKRLATHSASSIDVLLHAMRFVEQRGQRDDLIVLIEPSTPFLLPSDVDGCYDLLVKRGGEAVVTVSQHKTLSRYIAPLGSGNALAPLARKMRARTNGMQQVEYTPNGVLYMSRWEALKRRKSFYHARTFGYVTEPDRSVEIDTPMDLCYAQLYARTPQWRRLREART